LLLALPGDRVMAERPSVPAEGGAAPAEVPTIEVAAAKGFGWYACAGGRWVQHGTPAYPPPSRPCADTIAPPAPVRSEAECTERGGTWRAVGILPQKICVLPTGDAGRTCGDGGECEGTCLAALSEAERDAVMRRHQTIVTTGQCSPAIPLVGCLAIVREGVVSGIVCYD
jgi:hypothetical protein